MWEKSEDKYSRLKALWLLQAQLGRPTDTTWNLNKLSRLSSATIHVLEAHEQPSGHFSKLLGVVEIVTRDGFLSIRGTGT